MNSHKQPYTRFLSVAGIGLLLLLSPHCQDFFERDTEITMDGKNPPTFTLSGNGQVSWIEVTDRSTSDVSVYAPERIMWRIRPTGEYTPSRFPKITYGVVPQGFTQEIPATGAPPALAEEKPYLVSAPTSNANTGTMMLLIRNGQALRVEKADDGQYHVQTPKPN